MSNLRPYCEDDAKCSWCATYYGAWQTIEELKERRVEDLANVEESEDDNIPMKQWSESLKSHTSARHNNKHAGEEEEGDQEEEEEEVVDADSNINTWSQCSVCEAWYCPACISPELLEIHEENCEE